MTNGIESSGVSVMSEEKASPRKHRDSNKVKSVYGVGHKKKMHPLMLGPGRPNPGKLISLHSASKNNLSEFTQRIMSAKLLRVKQVQNQLNETQIQLNELINENRALRNMQKRQEGALRRYEGHHAELPQLIRSHNEEIRALKASNKIIKAQLRESNLKLRERENELETLKENYNKLKKLSTEKNLLEREKLQKKVEDLEDVIKEQEEKIQVLSRKILLESKNYRHHLNVEVIKHKETQKDLNSALSMISKLENQLIAKDRAIPSSKILLRRDNKAGVSLLTNKSLSLAPKIGVSEDNIISRKKGNERIEIEESPDVELELLNEMISSEETPSPTQDIFPDMHKQKISNVEGEATTERSFSNSETFQTNNEPSEGLLPTSKHRKTPLPKKSSTFSADLEMNAKMIAGTISEDMQAIDELTLKLKNSSRFEGKSRLSSIYEEVKSNVTKFDRDITNLEKINEEDDTQISPLETRRNVPKRKLEEHTKSQQLKLLEPTKTANEEEEELELSDVQQQKYETMTKTWDSLKSRIKKERKKAEEKMKELNKVNGIRNLSDSASSGSEVGKPEDSSSSPEDQSNATLKQELRFVNFTDDAYILQELEKTDKIFNRLRNENKKSFTKTSPSLLSSAAQKSQETVSPAKPKQQNVKSFRSESQREPQFLKEFQSEYQKQNLIKALKAIDGGKDSSLSNEESEDSDSDKKKNFLSPKKARNALKQFNKLTYSTTDKDLMTELFGSGHSKLESADSLKLECPATTGADNK